MEFAHWHHQDNKCTVIPSLYYYCHTRQHRGPLVLLGHEVKFKPPRGLHIIADSNKLWFCVSAGVCFRGQKDKQSWRLTVWAQLAKGVHTRHFEGHVHVQIHSNLIEKPWLFLTVSNFEVGWGGANDILKKTEEDILMKGFWFPWIFHPVYGSSHA